MAHGFKSYYIVFFNNWRALGKDKVVSVSKSLRHESCIGFWASCAPESFYDWGDFLLNSIHTDICYLQRTILQENLSSCSCGKFLGFAALFGWSRRFMINLSINRQTMTATITPWQNPAPNKAWFQMPFKLRCCCVSVFLNYALTQ